MKQTTVEELAASRIKYYKGIIDQQEKNLEWIRKQMQIDQEFLEKRGVNDT